MYQQINLYQPVFRRQQKVFSAVTLAQILAAVLVLLLTLLSHAYWNLSELKTTRVSLQQQYDQLQQALDAMSGETTSAENTKLDAEIASLTDTIASREQLLEQFSQLILDNSGGYAAYFEALARRDLPGLWLTGVEFEDNGAIKLHGMALDPKLVPAYLQMLAREPELRDQQFDSVIIKRQTTGEPVVEFVLRNARASQEDLR